MSTWDDKPNDYEHALAEIERLETALGIYKHEADAQIEWQKTQIERLQDRCNRAEAWAENEAIINRELRAALDAFVKSDVADYIPRELLYLIEDARAALANQGKG